MRVSICRISAFLPSCAEMAQFGATGHDTTHYKHSTPAILRAHDPVLLATSRRRSVKARPGPNTSRDKLRARERLELFLFLDQIGLTLRPLFLKVKPHVSSSVVSYGKSGMPASMRALGPMTKLHREM